MHKYGYIHTLMNLFHHKDKKQPLNSQLEKQPMVCLYFAVADNPEPGLPRSVASFSILNTELEMELLTFCLRCTSLAATVPQGGIGQQQNGSGIAAAENHQTLRKLLSIIDVITPVMR